MATNKRDVELAISAQTDMERAHADLRKIQTSIDTVATATEEWSRASERASAAQAAATAEQETRLRAMVAASLEQRAAMDAVAEANRRPGAAARAAVGDWQASAAAQSAVMNAHTAAERAAEQHAMAEQRAAAAAAQATAAFQKQSAELSELLGRIDPVSRELERLDKLEQRLRASRSAGVIDADGFDRYNAKLQAQRAALTGSANAMKHAGISAGQYQMAMRQLPMQITDITTSLASGMPIWLVAIQQGGQIKDSFGGWRNAARALVSTINPMTVAVAASAAVVGTFFLAVEAGERQHAAFNEALIRTGNYAGQTSASLEELSRAAAGASGVGRAREVLTGLAASGRVGAEAFESVGRAAVAMAELSGKSAEQVVTDIGRMTDDVARWAVEADKQYHFLNTGTLAQIRNLQEQGRATEAARVASDAFFEAATERSKDLTNNLTTLQRAWKGLGGTIKGLWEDLKDVSTSAAATWAAMSKPVSEVGTADLQALLRLQEWMAGFAQPEAQRQQRQQTIAAIRAELEAREQVARQQAAQIAAEDKANAALTDIAKRREENLTREERKQRELNKLVADYVALWNQGKNASLPQLQGVTFEGGRPAGGQFEIDRQRIEERFKEPKSRTREQQSAYAGLNRQITERIAALEAAGAAETKLTETQRFSARLLASMTDGTVKLTEAERERLKVRLQALASADQQNQVRQDAKALADVQLQYLKAIGDGAGTATAEIEKKFGDLVRRLEARGDQAGVALVQKLINVEQAQVQVEELQRQIERILSDQSRTEQSIQTRQQAGLISEINARQQLVDLNQRTAAQLEAVRPDLEALTGAPGAIGERASQALAQLNLQAQQLRATAGALAETLRTGFEEGLTGALEGLATGAQNLREAVRGLLNEVTAAIARLASQAIADSITSRVAGLFSGGGDGGGQAAAAAAITAASATGATTMGTAISTGGGAAATAMGTAITAAGATAAAQMATAIAAAQSAEAAGNALKGLATVAASTGGHIRGPGSGTSDSIPAWLSDYEFVTRSAVVRQPGALQFLQAFNRDGMAALRQFRFAGGGLATVRAGQAAAPLQPMGGPGDVVVSQRLLPVLDEDLIIDSLRGPKGEQLVELFITRNPAKYRAAMGIS